MTRDKASGAAVVDPVAKKAKRGDDDGVVVPPSTTTASTPAPPYGSQQYWEDRYRRQFDTTTTTSKSAKEDDASTKKDDTLPYHAWYFSYDELRPLIIPLLLGGREEARTLLASVEAQDDDDDDDDDQDDDETSPDQGDTANDETAPIRPAGSTESKGSSDAADENEDDAVADENEDDDGEDEDDGDDDEDDDLEEVEGEEEEDEDVPERDGISTYGPANVLEVGCGDVPLGVGLALELSDLQEKTGAMASGIVRRILCTDYSQVVVDMMKKQYCCDFSAADAGTTKETTDAKRLSVQSVPLEFATSDARKMSYQDKSFDLILEKGTLDAMLSDKEEGVTNSIQIVTECARVLATRGYIVLISHLNAHTDKGIDWLQEVVFTGLKGGDAEASWLIEVHGQGEENTDGAAGPAVYVVQKQAKSTDSTKSDQQTIPVKFYSY